MMSRSIAVPILWLALVLGCVFAVTRITFTADLSAFLPSAPTKEQALLVDLLKDGIASRVLLIGIEGGDAADRANASRELQKKLDASPLFINATNGESLGNTDDQQWLFDHRYLLSATVTEQRFSAAGLHQAIGNSIDRLSSSTGVLTKSLFTQDPTGETLQVIRQLDSRNQGKGMGLWVSRDGNRTLLLATTAARGSDIDAQQSALQALRQSFTEVARSHSQSDLTLLVTGPGKFAVDARDTIKSEVTSLTLIGVTLIVVLLLVIYRSPSALLLSLVPVVTGGLVGIVAVAWGFGHVHGITLGFGIPLIGEAVDYAIYFFVKRDRNNEIVFWRTIWIGVLTSIVGFGALLASGFPGLAQVGLFSISGLITAVLTTRLLLPVLTPADLKIRDTGFIGQRLSEVLIAYRWLRLLPLMAGLAAIAVITSNSGQLWNHDIGSLSPVPDAAQELDAELRRDLPAPDVRYLVVVSAPDFERVIARAEALQPMLDELSRQGAIGGFDSPARFLPSRDTQLSRIAALPDRSVLEERLASATADLPTSVSRLQPFLDAVEDARQADILELDDLDGTLFETAVRSMLLYDGDVWRATLPVHPPADGGSVQDQVVRQALATMSPTETLFVDIKAESQRLYAGYMDEARWASIGGVAGILFLLLILIRSPVRLLRLSLPLAAAGLSIVAILSLAGEGLILLHLIGLLLVVAVGSNYALFFDADLSDAGRLNPRTLSSLVVANLTTVTGFGILALSSVPVLHAIGIVVGPGALLALLFAAVSHGTQEGSTR